MLATLDTKAVKDLQAIYARAAAYEKQGKLVESARSYRYFLSKWPEPTAYYNYALVLKKMRAYDEAIQNYKSAIALRPGYVEAYVNIGNILAELGEFEKSLDYYDQAIRCNPTLVQAYYNRGIALRRLGRYEEALADFAKTLSLQPDFAQAHVDRGVIYSAAGDVEKALEQYAKAILRNPGFGQAYYNRGVVLRKIDRFDEALADFEKALALMPGDVQVSIDIGNVLTEKDEFERALETYDEVLRRNSNLPHAHYNRGVALQEMRRHEEALVAFDKALALDANYLSAYLNKAVILTELKRKGEAFQNYEQILRLDPAHVDATWNLALLKLSEGDFAVGWTLYESRLRGYFEKSANKLERPYWRGQEDVAGKTIFIRWEQGFGDTIQFSRYVVPLKDLGANVVLSVQAPLQRLLQRFDEGITVIGENEVPRDYDYFCFLMSLPGVFEGSCDTIVGRPGYLRAEPGERLFWKTRIDAFHGLKIGIVWAGGFRPDITSVRRNDANRSIHLRQVTPLLKVTGTAFFSLQKGPPAEQLASFESGSAIHDWTDELKDFSATAALIENLDLVITVDTAVAHLAAALGKPVWILMPWASCWRWFENRTDSPWYDTVRLFRQSERGDWEAVIETVKIALEALVVHAA